MAFLPSHPLPTTARQTVATDPASPYHTSRQSRHSRTTRRARHALHASAADYGPSPNGTAKYKYAAADDTAAVEDAIPAQTRPVPVSALKTELYRLAASTNRGLHATALQRARLLATVRELETASPAVKPVDDARLLTGRWKLLYTDGLDVLSLAILSPVAVVGEVFQNIYEAGDGEGYEFVVVVKMQPVFAGVANLFLGETVGEIRVAARGKRVSESRIELRFVEAGLRQEKVFGREFGLETPMVPIGRFSPVGFIETTFLDEDLRIGRSLPNNERTVGNVFVLMRDQ